MPDQRLGGGADGHRGNQESQVGLTGGSGPGDTHAWYQQHRGSAWLLVLAAVVGALTMSTRSASRWPSAVAGSVEHRHPPQPAAMVAAGGATTQSNRDRKSPGNFALEHDGLLAIPLLMTNRTRHSISSVHRIFNMATMLDKFDIPTAIVTWQAPHPGVNKTVATNMNFVRMLRKCVLSGHFQGCLILEGDTQLHPRLRTELASTWAELPAGAVLLHMCPGYLWGRVFNEDRGNGTNATMFLLHPEFRIKADPGKGRYFPEWPVNANHRKKNRGWVGAPVAFVVRQSHAAVIEEIVSRHLWQPIDMTLSLNRMGGHYVAREPLLCYEREFGGKDIF